MARTFLQTVQTVVRSLGETPPSSLSVPTETTSVVMGAVNDALAEIYNRARWDFRLKQKGYTFVVGDALYALPDDFGELHTVFLPFKPTGRHLQYVAYADLMAAHGDFTITHESIVDLDISLSMIAASGAYQVEAKGVPEYFTFFGNELLVWPPPDTDYCNTGKQFLVSYYRLAPELTTASATIPLPSSLWPAHTCLAQAYAKQYIEAPDYQVDEARAERLLAGQLKRKTKRTGAALRFRPRSW